MMMAVEVEIMINAKQCSFIASYMLHIRSFSITMLLPAVLKNLHLKISASLVMTRNQRYLFFAFSPIFMIPITIGELGVFG
jgi:hypothetical protein